MTEQQQSLLNELVKTVPVKPRVKKTIFDISGTAHREVVISRWYTYYLDPRNDHGIGTLFIDTLHKMLNRTDLLHHFVVEPEVGTENKKFIDILIRGIGRDFDRYIIIENKVYHTVNNPFQDYWNHCPAGSDKIGVLLTLKREPENDSHQFKNVVHREWVDAVVEALKSSQFTLTNEQQFLFNNFINAIYNLTRYYTMNENAAYFFREVKAINDAVCCKDEARKFIQHQLEFAAHFLKMKLGRTDDMRLRDFIISDYDTEACISVIFDKLLTEDRELRIVLALRRKNLGRVSELDTQFQSKAISSGFIMNDNPGVDWHNYLTKKYRLTHEQISSLYTFVVTEVKDVFLPFSMVIGAHLAGKQALEQAPNIN